MIQPLITLDSVWFAYGKHKALQDVSGFFDKGTLTAVAGPNGAGKSTLLKIIAGVLKPQRGFVRFAPEIAGKIAYLPQGGAISRDYPITVFQVACAGLWPEIGSLRDIGSVQREKVLSALEEVGLVGFEGRQIDALSGGEFQRLLFARVILQDPAVVLLDEPFAAIDAETTARLMQILLRWHEQGRTIICVLHDLMLIRKYFPESFVLAGKCLGRGHTHDLLEQKLLSFDLDMAELLAPADAQGKKGGDHDHA